MSGYRRLKRALGETNIERKCRVLFGVCLALLIFAASLGVESICRRLVKQVIHQAGTDAVDWALVYIHFEFWQQPPETVDHQKQKEHQGLLEDFRDELKRERFDFRIIQLPGE